MREQHLTARELFASPEHAAGDTQGRLGEAVVIIIALNISCFLAMDLPLRLAPLAKLALRKQLRPSAMTKSLALVFWWYSSVNPSR